MREDKPDGATHSKSAWCPKCELAVSFDDAALLVTFTPIAAKLTPNGELDMGQFGDVFMDYDHMSCGTVVRFLSEANWDELLGEYVPSRAFIELTIDGVYQTEDHELLFSSSTDAAPETWGATYVSLLDLYKKALERLNERMETES
jgi:hypothetical protein